METGDKLAEWGALRLRSRRLSDDRFDTAILWVDVIVGGEVVAELPAFNIGVEFPANAVSTLTLSLHDFCIETVEDAA